MARLAGIRESTLSTVHQEVQFTFALPASDPDQLVLGGWAPFAGDAEPPDPGASGIILSAVPHRQGAGSRTYPAMPAAQIQFEMDDANHTPICGAPDQNDFVVSGLQFLAKPIKFLGDLGEGLFRTNRPSSC
jgi:hypothetical protein